MTRSTHHPNYRIFLDALREERKAKHVTQVQLADLLGNRQTFVSKLESGERRLDVVELIEYLNAIGSDPVAFIARLVQLNKSNLKRRERKLAIRRRPTKLN